MEPKHKFRTLQNVKKRSLSCAVVIHLPIFNAIPFNGFLQESEFDFPPNSGILLDLCAVNVESLGKLRSLGTNAGTPLYSRVEYAINSLPQSHVTVMPVNTDPDFVPRSLTTKKLDQPILEVQEFETSDQSCHGQLINVLDPKLTTSHVFDVLEPVLD
mmetsp:Transcript_94795/g.182799  ORF Transcript_94795/g.182799 Transcript_94795/m.182799 type:complete len:158 (+) Transcript_94795:627-1100(+)